jgi:EmrB/QacA subfamily drug resistance transporter
MTVDSDARGRLLGELGQAGRQSEVMMAESGDGIARAGEATKVVQRTGPQPPYYRTIALIIACALFMQNLDATVLATALPTMARDFAVPPTGIGFALTSYLLALAIFIPASGTIADRYGAQRIFQLAIALFVLGSIACGMSINLTTLVVARFAQGIGGAMMVPVGRLVLLRTVAKRDLVSAMSWLAMPAMIGPIFGPPVGGLIVTYLDWRWIFWINVPMGMLGIVLVRRFIDDVRSADVPSFDGRGFVLSGLALGATIFGLQLASREVHAGAALPLLLVGVAASAGYVAHARRTPRPILELSLMRVPTFRLSVLGGTLIRITQGAQPFLLPMLMQLAFGLNAAQSGAVTVATAIGAFAMKSVARPALRRFGFRTTLTTIGVLAPLSYAVTGFFRPGWPWPVISAVLLVCGFFVSLQFTAYNTIAYDEIEPSRLSAATSFYSTVQQLALSLGVCAAASSLSLAMALHGHARPQFDDFSIAIWSVVAISLAAIVCNLRFDRSAGAELSGHVSRERNSGSLPT